MLDAVIDYAESGTQLERVVFCLYWQTAYDTFAAALASQTD